MIPRYYVQLSTCPGARWETIADPNGYPTRALATQVARDFCTDHPRSGSFQYGVRVKRINPEELEYHRTVTAAPNMGPPRLVKANQQR